MKPHRVSALIALSIVAGTSLAQQKPGNEPGWTGLTAPDKVIEARRLLMDELEQLITPLDLYTVGEPADERDLKSAARTISRMMLAVPHLFPPTTNAFDPAADDSPTNALPAVWTSFDAFVALSDVSEAAASRMAETSGAEPLRDAARSLRASCDACHAVYLKAYEAPATSVEDVEFDFDSVLPNE